MAKCPRCNSPVKLTGKEWDYGPFHVKQHSCSDCEKMFMEYYKDDKLSHIIPKKKDYDGYYS
jgi:5-methylcytosine-specific restriction endonuclease McrA